MRKCIVAFMLLVFFATPAIADLGLPSDSSHGTCALGNFSIGIETQRGTNGDILILVYREVFSNYQDYNNTSVCFNDLDLTVEEILPPPENGVVFHPAHAYTLFNCDSPDIIGEELGHAGAPGCQTSGRTGYLWSIQAFLWPSYMQHNGSWRIKAVSGASLTLYLETGTTTSSINNIMYDKELPVANMNYTSTQTPCVFKVNDEIPVNQTIPIVLSDIWPLTNETNATVQIYSLETNALVKEDNILLTTPTLPADDMSIDPTSWTGNATCENLILPRGLYTCNVIVSHTENGWQFNNAVNDWPWWQTKDYRNGVRNIGAGSVSGDKDEDQRVSTSLAINSISVKENSPSGLLVTYNLTAEPASSGIVVYDMNLNQVGNLINNPSPVAGSNQVIADLPNADYYFIVYATEKSKDNKIHLQKPALERGIRYLTSMHPVILHPRGTIAELSPIVEWQADYDYDRYRICVMNGTTLVWDSGELSGKATSAQITTLLANNTEYSVVVKTGNGITWAESEPASFTINFIEPPLPKEIPYCL